MNANLGASLLAMLLPLAFGQTASTADPPANVARFLELCERYRRGAILQVEHQLRGLENQSLEEPRAKRQRARKLGDLQEQLERLQKAEELFVPELTFLPQTRAIGRLPGNECYVDQVISSTELLVRGHFRVPVTVVRNFKRYREIVVKDVQFVIRSWEGDTPREGQDLETDAAFEVVGRESYAIAGGGQKSILVLVPIDLRKFEPYRK